MTYLQRASALIGQPIVTLDTATDVAEVRDVIYAPERSEIAGFALRGRGFFSSPDAGVLPLADVRSIGRDAVMVASADRVRIEDPAFSATLEERRDVVGNEVLTDAGNVIGRVLDLVVEIDRSRATVVGYEVRRDDGSHVLIPLPDTFSVSGERLLVPAGVEGFAGHDLADFATALARHREHSGAGRAPAQAAPAQAPDADAGRGTEHA